MSTIDSDLGKKRAQPETLSGRKKRREKNKNVRNIQSNSCSYTTKVEVSKTNDSTIDIRLKEINDLQYSMKNAKNASTAQTFQSLPVTLRRRAASHNPKRVPKSVRERAIREMQKSPPGKKRSKRMIRRPKPKSLVQEYLRRQLNHKWLETHIWHTKRMKMKNIWDYRLATKPNVKSERAIYRSFSHITTIHDASYFRCLEWSGNKESIVTLLQQWTDPSLPSVGSQRYINGNRIGHQLLYTQYPHRFLCPITFLWRQHDIQLDQGQLWIWIHPCVIKDVFTMFNEKVVADQVMDVQVIDRKDELLRFDFTGPRSTALLQTILEPVHTTSLNAQIWNDLNLLRSSSSLPPGCVLSLEVKDPRLRFPQKVSPRNSEPDYKSDAKIEQLCLHWPDKVAISELWDADYRNILYENKISDYQLFQQRKEQLLDTTSKTDTVPILLYQRGCLGTTSPFNNHHHHNSNNNNNNSKELKEGWSLILPRGWGVPFWKSFIFAGARVIGLFDTRSMHLESGLSFFPYDYPGTPTWEVLRLEYKESVESIWQKKPPGKRVNYHHIGTHHPFEAAFETLISSSPSSYWIIQQRQLLKFALSSSISTFLPYLQKQQQAINEETINQLLTSALIRIKIILTKGGKPVQNAKVYITSHDHHHQNENKNENKLNHPIGYLTSAGFSLSEGCGVGIGAITLNGFRELLDNNNTRQNNDLNIDQQLPVFIKNPQSLKHRPGLLTILI
ncbi:unnamed protein product [Cunninghamella echinulata]